MLGNAEIWYNRSRLRLNAQHISCRMVLYLLQGGTVSPVGWYCMSCRVVLYVLQGGTVSPAGWYCLYFKIWTNKRAVDSKAINIFPNVNRIIAKFI